jgi:hypothetical protein
VLWWTGDGLAGGGAGCELLDGAGRDVLCGAGGAVVGCVVAADGDGRSAEVDGAREVGVLLGGGAGVDAGASASGATISAVALRELAS